MAWPGCTGRRNEAAHPPHSSRARLWKAPVNRDTLSPLPHHPSRRRRVSASGKESHPDAGPTPPSTGQSPGPRRTHSARAIIGSRPGPFTLPVTVPVPTAPTPTPTPTPTPAKPLGDTTEARQALMDKGVIAREEWPVGRFRFAADLRKVAERQVPQDLLVDACLERLAEPPQPEAAIQFLDALIDGIESMENLNLLLHKFAPLLLDRYPPPCADAQIPRIRAAIAYCAGHTPSAQTCDSLRALCAAYCPGVVIEQALTDACDALALLQRQQDAVSVDQALVLIGQLCALQNQAIDGGFAELAKAALDRAERVAQLNSVTQLSAAVSARLSEMRRCGERFEVLRFASAAQRSLLGGDPPLAWRQGSGASAHFGFLQPVNPAALEPLITELCEDGFKTGDPHEAFALLNDALGAVPDPGFRHRLLTRFAAEPPFVNCALQHRRPHATVEAAHTLLQGWWLDTPPHAFEAPLRERLLALLWLSEPESSIELFAKELAHGIDRSTRQQLEEGAGQHLLQRLELLQRHAEARGDAELMSRCLQWSRRLAERLGPEAQGALAALKKRCTPLIKSCQRQLPDLCLQRLSEWLTVEQRIGDDRQTHTFISVRANSEPLRTQEGRALEWARFTDYVDLALADPNGPSWNHLVKLIRKASNALQWQPDFMQWVCWGIREAGRQSTQPLEQQLHDIVAADHDWNKARDQFFDALCHESDRGAPWATLENAMQAVQLSRGFQLTPQQRLRLCLMQAKRGDLQALTALLKAGIDSSLAKRPLLNELLALCGHQDLKLAARVQLLVAAKPLFPTEADLAWKHSRLLKKLRQQRKERRDSRAVPTPRRPPDTPAKALPLQQARQALAAWVQVDDSSPAHLKLRLSPQTAPQTSEQRAQAQAALLSWMRAMLVHQPRPWSQLLSVAEGIELSWGWNFDRQALLALCLEEVERTDSAQALLEHLPLLNGPPPDAPSLARLLQLTGRSDWSPHLRAELLQRQIAWLPASGEQHATWVQALLALPEGLRDALRQRFLQRHGAGLREDIAQLLARSPGQANH